MTGAHPDGQHPEFMVGGEYSHEPRFAVDLHALVTSNASDWARLRRDHDGDFEEAVNRLVVEVVSEDAGGAGFLGANGLHWDLFAEPQVDWEATDGLLDALQSRLEADGLWGDGTGATDGPEPPVVNCPGQTALDL
jgi:hypothetical protein